MLIGHCGDGSFRILTLIDPEDLCELERAEDAVALMKAPKQTQPPPTS